MGRRTLRRPKNRAPGWLKSSDPEADATLVWLDQRPEVQQALALYMMLERREEAMEVVKALDEVLAEATAAGALR